MSLKINNLDFGYPGKVLGTNNNLELRKGELIALIGPNGVGKSTFLKTIYGLIPALAGDVSYDGENVLTIKKDLLARKVSVLLTEKFYVDYMTVPELLKLGLYAKDNLSNKEVDKLLIEVRDFFGLSYIWNSYFEELSDGQKQRVLLARASVQSMETMVLDEPTTYLDVKGKRELFKLLKRLTIEKKSSILLSTHDLDLAFEFSTKIWVLGCSGTIVEVSPEVAKTSGIINETFGL